MSGRRDRNGDPEDDMVKMTFAEHFEELRRRLVVCFASVIILFVVCYIFSDELVQIILLPYNAYRDKVLGRGGEDPGKLMYISLPEGFLFYLKTAFLSALFLSFPVILHQLWKFIGAGLYKKERRAVMRVLPFSIFMFLAGILFGYFVLFPIGMQFLMSFPDQDLMVPSITVSKYFDLFFILNVIMGFMFQTPLLMVVTTKIGLTTPALFSSKRKYFLLGAFVVGAVMTPPDAVTQCLLAIPLLGLFELGILLSKRVAREAAEEEGKDGGEAGE